MTTLRKKNMNERKAMMSISRVQRRDEGGQGRMPAAAVKGKGKARTPSVARTGVLDQRALPGA